MAWVLYGVSQHPAVEAKLVAELASLGLLATPGNPTPRTVEWDDLPKLVYLDAVIKAPPFLPMVLLVLLIIFRFEIF
jgi:hypothetical protein